MDYYNFELAREADIDRANQVAMEEAERELSRELARAIATINYVADEMGTDWIRREFIKAASQPCPDCEGEGKLEALHWYWDGTNNSIFTRCDRCEGRGDILPDWADEF